MRYEVEPFHRNIPDGELIADLQRIAGELKQDSITVREYDSRGKFRSSTIMERFGGWTSACLGAGLATRHSPKNPSDEDLFTNIEEIWIKLGRQPRYREITKPLSKFTVSPYLTRHRSWQNALEAFATYISETDTSSLEAQSESPRAERNSTQQGTRKVNWRLRFIVMRRDNFKCKACGRTPATDPSVTLDVDHIKAWSKGGLTILENLQTLCTKCNIGKSDLEFLNSSQTEVLNVEA